MRDIKWLGWMGMVGLLGCASLEQGADRPGAPNTSQPNIVVFFADDLGWGDVGVFEGSQLATPNLDRLAGEGLRLTSFYVGAPACSPSRAALLTGCYPVRVGIPEVLGPGSKIGLHPEEETLAELLRDAGYRTQAIGKWHLGDAPEHLPMAHGFDDWTGLPYSNDMWPYHYGDQDRGVIGNPNWPDLPVYDHGVEVETNPRQDSLTPFYTKRALEFVDGAATDPFFLYFAFSHPHVPIAASQSFQGKSGQGLYADMILEIDDAVGQVVERLKALGLAENTIIVFTSDNGPWTRFGDHAGTTGPWRGDKGTCYEGGMRMPAIVWGPGLVPGGRTSDHLVTAMDLLPTLAGFAQAKLPKRSIDGMNMGGLFRGQGRTPVREAFYYYYPGALHAVRSGKWKLHVPHPFREVVTLGSGGVPGEQRFVDGELALYDLEADPGETTDLAEQYPGVVEELQSYIRFARHDLGDSLTEAEPMGLREPGRLAD